MQRSEEIFTEIMVIHDAQKCTLGEAVIAYAEAADSDVEDVIKALGDHAHAVFAMDAVASSDGVHMAEGPQRGQLQPEVPVLEEIESFVKAATSCDSLFAEEQGMDRNGVFYHQACRIVGFVVNPYGFQAAVSAGANALDAGIGGDGVRLCFKALDEVGDVFGLQPVVVVEEEHEITLGAIQPQVGGSAALK